MATTCHECGGGLDHDRVMKQTLTCEDCERKAELLGEIDFIAATLGKARTAAARGDRMGLRSGLRDTRHAVEILEKYLWRKS